MESLEGVGQNLSPLPGWANQTLPFNATTVCGGYVQTEVFTATGSTAEFIAFDTPLSWTTAAAWTSEDGVTWTCQIPGIYSMNISQTLEVQNIAEIQNPVIQLAMNVNDANNSELDQVYTTTFPVPITTAPIVLCQNVTNIVNANVGTEMTFSVESPSGGITLTSGTGLSDFYQAFTFNLIARGVVGNVVP
jgi:hypothetical protein